MITKMPTMENIPDVYKNGPWYADVIKRNATVYLRLIAIAEGRLKI